MSVSREFGLRFNISLMEIDMRKRNSATAMTMVRVCLLGAVALCFVGCVDAKPDGTIWRQVYGRNAPYGQELDEISLPSKY